MFKYEDFIILESLNESIIYFTPNFRKNITKVDSEVARSLLDVEGKDIKPDVTFVDMDKDGYLSFSTMRNVLPLLKTSHPHLFDDEKTTIDKFFVPELADGIWNRDISDTQGEDHVPSGISKKSRNLLKIGKFVNRVFPNKFTDKQIEDFVNQFKASIENSKEKMEIAQGEDIAEWYAVVPESGGTLGSSCMRGKLDIFKLYTENPDVCRMLIIVEDGIMRGRAIVWKIDTIGYPEDIIGDPIHFEYFMDRQYTNRDSDVEKMKKYAKDNGWAYKTFNNHHSFQQVTFGGKDHGPLVMTIKANPPSNGLYPYMDTFRRFDPINGVLHNDNEDSNKFKGHFIMDDTNGDYTEIGIGNWSDYYEEKIPSGHEVWSDPLQDFLYMDRSVEITRGRGDHKGWWPDGHPDVQHSDYYNEYIHLLESLFSRFHGSWLLAKDLCSVVNMIYLSGRCNEKPYYVISDGITFGLFISFNDMRDMTWFKWTQEKYEDEWDEHEGILKEILVKNSNRKWIPEILELETFLVDNVDDDLKISYLTKIDALVLGYTLTDDVSITDAVEYNTSLYNKKMYDILIESHKKYINDISTSNEESIDKRQEVLYNKRLSRSRLDELKDKKFIFKN